MEGKNVTSEVYVIMFIELHGKSAQYLSIHYPLSAPFLPFLFFHHPFFVSFFLSVRTRRNKRSSNLGRKQKSSICGSFPQIAAQFPNEILNHFRATDGWNGDLRYPREIMSLLFYSQELNIIVIEEAVGSKEIIC